MNRNPRNRLPRILKTTDQQAEETRGDHYTDVQMSEIRTGQQVAQHHVS
jgi:hypothetical protein